MTRFLTAVVPVLRSPCRGRSRASGAGRCGCASPSTTLRAVRARRRRARPVAAARASRPACSTPRSGSPSARRGGPRRGAAHPRRRRHRAVDAVAPSRLVDSVVSALAARAGSPSTFDVLLLVVAAQRGDAPERGTNLVAESSVPADLRTAVVDSQRQSWTYTEIQYLDGRTAPGLVVGAPLLGARRVGPYELYYLFPLDPGAGDPRPGAQLGALAGLAPGAAARLRRLARHPAGRRARCGAASQTAARLGRGHLPSG